MAGGGAVNATEGTEMNEFEISLFSVSRWRYSSELEAEAELQRPRTVRHVAVERRLAV